MNEMRKCPKFYRCSAPICPLDPDVELRVYITGDAKCTLDKKTRKLLGKNLPNRGLFPRELSAIKGWKKVPLEEHSRRVKFAKKNLVSPKMRGVKK